MNEEELKEMVRGELNRQLKQMVPQKGPDLWK